MFDGTAPADRVYDEWTPVDIDFVEAIASNPDVYALADLIGQRPQGDGGRPSLHPPVVYVITVALASVLGSHRKAASAIANKYYWAVVRDAARRTAHIELCAMPPTRNMCEYHRGKIAEHVDTLAARFRELAVAQALECGWLNPDVTRSTSQPQRANFVAADGKVAKSPILEKTAERWRQQGRHINASRHTQGGSTAKVFGAKFWLATTRATNRRNDRVIIDIRHIVKSDGGEAAVATAALEALAQKAPGLHGVCYDGAFRGVHIDRLLKRGLTVLSPTHGGTKATPMTTVRCGCGDSHELWTQRGAICERHILDTGETTFTSSPVARRYSRRNTNGIFRWYIDIALACGTVHTERLDTTPDDDKSRYNRTEHLRQYVASGADSVYHRCYGWREDAESVNDLIQQTLHKGRMIAYTAQRQFLVMLGFAIGRNSLTRWLRKLRA
ncbi:Uncharacterised protein [Mycobacteroides abscessus subsp. bolletii]|uniref:hypothetical protein n=1 Tax=Mycobacteroides abscessus TaxID=36809 RepID=UPI0009CBB4EB|nr:hypothetical protein [Mycobacteroides abscessus]SKG85679.1 Uncharacterised protein [Mycobacteroides abscessus subsp. bolletii]SKH44641.1 Uncharacterised protein [Mycobacteroides abscessus subsp. bolletii]